MSVAPTRRPKGTSDSWIARSRSMICWIRLLGSIARIRCVAPRYWPRGESAQSAPAPRDIVRRGRVLDACRELAIRPVGEVAQPFVRRDALVAQRVGRGAVR